VVSESKLLQCCSYTRRNSNVALLDGARIFVDTEVNAPWQVHLVVVGVVELLGRNRLNQRRRSEN
jgi:hypothetical protein